MRVDFKMEGSERAEELMKQIEEKKNELQDLCQELGKCFRIVVAETKEQPQETAAQSYDEFISNPKNLDLIKTALGLK